ncbi:hypothetical protein T484DRAFT_1951651 [Baffinella frigidus]|nr:hypothetical protein T484DRAFT_1951651 [Cryptophyta sp. CCMP2293]
MQSWRTGGVRWGAARIRRDPPRRLGVMRRRDAGVLRATPPRPSNRSLQEPRCRLRPNNPGGPRDKDNGGVAPRRSKRLPYILLVRGVSYASG